MSIVLGSRFEGLRDRLTLAPRVLEKDLTTGFTEQAIALPLIVVEDLVRGRLIWKQPIRDRVAAQIERGIHRDEAGLQHDEPADRGGIVLVFDAGERGFVFSRLADTGD